MNMPGLRKAFLRSGVLGALLLVSQNVNATYQYFVGDGAWEAPANWHLGVPGYGDYVFIGGGRSVTVETGITAHADYLTLGLLDTGTAGGYPLFGSGTLELAGGTLDLYASCTIGQHSVDPDTGEVSWVMGTFLMLGGEFNYTFLNVDVGSLTIASGTINGRSGMTIIRGGTVSVSSSDDSPTTWNTGEQLSIGADHADGTHTTGHLSIGGPATTVTSGYASIGAGEGCTGYATIDGGATWNANLIVGASGNGTLTVGDEATLNVRLTIGENAGSSGLVDINGGTVSGSYITVGQSGTGVLNLNAGTVTLVGTESSTGSLEIGKYDGANGTVTIANGAAWNGDAAVSVGGGGTGLLNIEGGSASFTNLWITGLDEYGSAGSGQGVVNISAGDVQISDDLYVIGGDAAQGGKAELNIGGGAVTVGGDVSVGTYRVDGSDIVGKASVTGGSLAIGGNLVVGDDGTGVLDIAGGTVGIPDSGTTTVGKNSGAHGTVNISEGQWNTSALFVGAKGGGEVNISSGTVATHGNAILGGNEATSYDLGNYEATGTVNLTGGSWEIDGKLTLGMQSWNNPGEWVWHEGEGEGDGWWDIVGGGKVYGTGTVNVDGGTLSANNLDVGNYGKGVLNISSGAATISEAIIIGRNSESVGTVKVTGGTLTSESLIVGYNNGTGELDISGGTVETTGGAVVGGSYYWNQGVGTANVTGGLWEIGGDLVVGGAAADPLISGGIGTLYVNGGIVSAANIYIGQLGGDGTLRIDSGTVNVSGQIVVAQDEYSHGTLDYNGGDLNAASIVIGSGSATVNFNQTGTTTIGFALTGNLDLNVNNSGTTTLATANTYTGKTTINAGMLVLEIDASIDNSYEVNLGGSDSQGTLDVSAKPEFAIGSGQTLSGYGTVNLGTGKTLSIHGVLTPGNSAGIATVIGNVALDSTSSTFMELAGSGGVAGTDFDQLNVSGELAYGGDLSIQGFGGYLITQNGSYDLFDFASQMGDFSSVLIGTTALALDAGVWTGSDEWASYSFDQSSGVLDVVAVPEAETAVLVGLGLTLLLLRRRLPRS